MVSINVELEDDLAELLRRLAAVQNRSENDILREALAVYAQSQHPLPKGMGQYRSGCPDVSEQTRDILRHAAKEGIWP